jgi:prepilin-type N-terminal cleavage/methylation domain-containing protein
MTKSSPLPAKHAFTLIELLVVIAGIGTLLALAVPALTSAYERAKVTKDLSNLRQIGAATQMYMNDNNGAFPGSATATWMLQLEQNQKYLSAWRVLQSPFDNRIISEKGTGSPVSNISYGINANVYDANNAALSADKITKPVTFIVFAPAQAATATVTFQGIATSPAPGVKVLAATSTPPGAAAPGGPHNNRAKINALCADWHAETMLWTGTTPAFINTTATGTDTDGDHRWNP